MIHPIEYSPTGAMVSFSGQVFADEILEANKALLSHPEFPNHKFAIWNYLSAGSLSYDKAQIRSIAEQDRRDSWKNPNRKVAVVANSPILFGLARMYEAYYGGGPWEIKVFYDLEQAEQWVGIKGKPGCSA